MNKELRRLNRLIESNGKKLSIIQAQQDKYLKQRAEIHNTLMLQMLNEYNVTPQMLQELLDRAKTQSIVPKAHPAQEDTSHA
jgi:hypothetical protein